MKVIKVLLALVIAGSLAVTGVSLVKVIGVQRVMGEKQEALLGEVERQDEAVEAIIPAFQPTEEMVGKTEAMLADLQALAAVVSEMNGLVQAANGLQATTAGLLDMNNTSITRLAAGVSAADLPLAAHLAARFGHGPAADAAGRGLRRGRLSSPLFAAAGGTRFPTRFAVGTRSPLPRALPSAPTRACALRAKRPA